MDLREKIAKIITEASIRYHDHGPLTDSQAAEWADEILAIPEIAEALSYRALVQIDQQEDGSLVVVPRKQTA